MSKSIAEQLQNFGVSNKKLQQFDVFTIPDKVIDFPEVRLGQKRTRHEKRFIIVLQNNIDNEDPLIKIVLIAPMSSGDKHYRLDYKLSKKDLSFLPRDSYIRFRHTQPILKADLGTKWGNVGSDVLRDHIRDRIFTLFDLAE